ncbi:hypothetical protein DPMN_043104 [Dreissena polymorpha]|uniref:Reverse transcriptase domain-containing protein n=1 Tax=Dreissena polymorpha TaxID=45954 RepID=A0A9D4D398_DREPO|nr:hypothetical protein DPMN_043104 [Dreissena polymorpha]
MWTLRKHFDYLDFADDLALFSRIQQNMHKQINIVADISARNGLTLKSRKSKVFKASASSDSKHTVKSAVLEEMDSFIYA